ncbi:MAG: hypothetical protein ACYTGG_02465 [Planctomycetota bacterium]|jgi:hypothetical protein
MRPPASSATVAGLILLAPVLVGLEATRAADPPAANDRPPGAMVALRREVARYDFEEGATVALPTPFPFHRVSEPNEGFPLFGDIGYANDHAASGDWSFRFDLDGESIAARVPTAVINVMPLGDYLVSTRVRTEGLTHARTRLVAWLIDTRGEVIPGSIVRSQPVRTAGRWTTLSVAIEGRYEHAADLVLELQLAQPRQYVGTELPADEPVFSDVRGRAWFDDVMVWHLPRIEMSTTSTANLVQAPALPTLEVSVRDLTGEPLLAHLSVRDLDGVEVYEKTFDAPRGRHPRSLPLPISTPGWYRAELTVRNADGQGGGRTIDFWVLPEIRRRAVPTTRRFAVSAPTDTGARLETVPHLVRALRAGGAVIPVWDAALPPAVGGELDDSLRQCLELLLNNRVEVVIALHEIPLDAARRAGLDTHQILELLAADASLWRPYLDELVSRFGLDVSRWQIGQTGQDDLFWQPDLETKISAAAASLAEVVPSARLMIPVRAEQQLPAPPRTESFHVSVPHQVAPTAIPAYVREWAPESDDLFVTFEELPADTYSPRQRAADLMLRTLHGWRAGLPQMAINAPWRETRGPGARLEPELSFGVWRLLAEQLDGRTFGGEFRLTDGAHCWILEGRSSDDAALVAWTDQVGAAAPVQLDMMLADGPVRVTDCTGASRSVVRTDGRHAIDLDPAPIFIEGVSLELARFRENFAISPDLVESVHRLHEHEITLHNPWDTSISGIVHLLDTDDWRITPRVNRFDIGPRGRALLPVTIVFDRAALSGRKTILARIELIADRDYSFEASTEIELGLRHVDFAATWRAARNLQTGRLDLVVTETVSNRGDRTMSLDLFLLGPDISRQRRPVAALLPGGTVIRTFRIDDGVARLAGRTLRVGVSDRLGAGRLNRELTIPTTLRETPASPAITRQPTWPGP